MEAITEKRWPMVILSPIQVADHVITVSSTVGLHPKQAIAITKAGQEPLELEVKKILSPTQFQVGPIGKSILTYSNPTDYDGGACIAVEQERNQIDVQAIQRAVYAEEPTVAIRNLLVDYFGKAIDTKTTSDGKNGLVVTGDVTIPPIEIPNGLKPANYDRVSLERDPDSKLILHAKFYLASVLVTDLLLSYDTDGDLIDVRKL